MTEHEVSRRYYREGDKEVLGDAFSSPQQALKSILHQVIHDRGVPDSSGNHSPHHWFHRPDVVGFHPAMLRLTAAKLISFGGHG